MKECEAITQSVRMLKGAEGRRGGLDPGGVRKSDRWQAVDQASLAVFCPCESIEQATFPETMHLSRQVCDQRPKKSLVSL